MIDVLRCDLCGCCVGVCPPDCIVLTDHSLHIIGSECTDCGLCLAACPVGALTGNSHPIEK
ncbi:4Fe-4S binding protein [bacterium]|nr:4Fe-4S binding protein [bacterium]